MRKKLTLIVLTIIALCNNAITAQTVNAKLVPDKGAVKYELQKTMEHNLSLMLTEINMAYEQDSVPFLESLKIDKFAINTIKKIWKNNHFYCDEPVFISRLWNLKSGYMTREIPIVIDTRDDEFNRFVFQWAVVDFDATGHISDFRFSALGTAGESFENSGDVVEAERQMIIRQYCERFRTAYNTKDLDFLNMVFSEDALIVTGKVVRPQTKNKDIKLPAKVVYTEQNKKQYLANLKKCFDANKWINVKFEAIIDNDGDTAQTISQSQVNPNFYGVRLRQEWRSSNGYHDEGYLFLLWDFTNEDEPIIHVRTWQPEYVDGKKLPDSEIFGKESYGF